MSRFYERLSTKCRSATRQDFAPQFLVSENSEDTGFIWEHRHLAFETIAGGEEYVSPVSSFSGWSTPQRKTMLEHNKILARTEVELKAYISSYELIMDDLVLWESCSVVAEWLDQMESASSYGWSLLKDDTEGLAYRKIWRTYMGELGKLGAKTLFVFDNSADLSFM